MRIFKSEYTLTILNLCFGLISITITAGIFVSLAHGRFSFGVAWTGFISGMIGLLASLSMPHNSSVKTGLWISMAGMTICAMLLLFYYWVLANKF